MKTIFTNGCFDILHIGHIKLFEYASSLGDKLIVGLNSDSSIRRLKGEKRPINKQEDRKIILESIKYIDKVLIFEEEVLISKCNVLHLSKIQYQSKLNELYPPIIVGFTSSIMLKN